MFVFLSLSFQFQCQFSVPSFLPCLSLIYVFPTPSLLISPLPSTSPNPHRLPKAKTSSSFISSFPVLYHFSTLALLSVYFSFFHPAFLSSLPLPALTDSLWWKQGHYFSCFPCIFHLRSLCPPSVYFSYSFPSFLFPHLFHLSQTA